MPNIRALTDINIKSIYVPLNRAAFVDDETAAELIALGQATDDEAHVEQALHMNPEVIEIAVPTAADKDKAKAKAKAAEDAQVEAAGKLQDEPAGDKGKKPGKIAPTAEEETGLFGE